MGFLVNLIANNRVLTWLNNRKTKNTPITKIEDPFSKHTRAYGVCSKCGNTKFFKRKNNKKCSACGNRTPL